MGKTFRALDMMRFAEVDGEVDIPTVRRETLLECVFKQIDIQTSCYVAGIPYRYVKWVAVQAAKHPEGAAEQLMMDIIRAKASGKYSLVSDLFDSDNPRWKAFLLEKTYPEEYGKRIEINTASREEALQDVQRRLAAADPEALMKAALEDAATSTTKELGP